MGTICLVTAAVVAVEVEKVVAARTDRCLVGIRMKSVGT